MMFGVVPGNTDLKNFVGNFIYPYVQEIVGGDQQAGRVTGLLIDLDINSIKGYLYDYSMLKSKIYEASMFLLQQTKKVSGQAQGE